MSPVSIEDVKDKADSLYRLVIIAARRANQIAKADTHWQVAVRSKKPTMAALEEVMDGKMGYAVNTDDEEDLLG